MFYSLKQEERETIAITSMADKTVSVSTAEPRFINRLEKLAEQFPDVYVKGEVTEYGEHSYTFPKRYLRFGRPLTEAQKEAARKHSPFVAKNPPAPRDSES